MEVKKLTIKEIESKIEIFQERIETLRDIIKEIKAEKKKEVLLDQLSSYKTSLNLLKKELNNR